MIRKRLASHFLPHFSVAYDFVSDHEKPHQWHHRAHALNLPALFVYLQVLVVLTVGLYVIRIKAGQILGIASFSAEQIISLTNAKRAQNGLGQLTNNGQLTQAAAAKAGDMFANDYWAHYSPSGKTPWSFISASGYRYIFAGENLARDFDDPVAVVEAWMNSSSHRSNLLDRNFKEIGVAVSEGKLSGREGTLVVQMFGTAVSQAPQTQPLAQTPVQGTAAVEQSPPETAQPVLRESSAPVAQNLQLETSKETVQQSGVSATVLASKQFSIAKAISLGIIGFIFLLFVLEVVVTLRRANVGLRSGVVAHLLLLGFVLFAVWYAVQGAIL